MTIRQIFNFLKKSEPKSTESAAELKTLSSLSQSENSSILKIQEEETRILWDLYKPKEEEGLKVFDEALTN